MSKTVDERVVSMEFDNRQFEKNVQTSMSTLDKLKAKLNFSGASKGLEEVNSAAKKVNFSGLSSGIETVQAKFSALEVMGVTALANITNQAVNTGKRMVSALTLDPITSGFKEYETQINAVQTILANTQSKGSTIDDVNKALDELNKYADMTIYNFTEMTRNIGTFTAAGVDLEKSVTSIKGIANLAAVSGSNAVQASTAMYQLSQALATGKVSLQDWNSVVNAGMGGQLFQDALKRTAEHFGTNMDAMIEKYGSFRASLTEGGWLTSEVLTETLTQLSGAYTEADLIAQGYSEQQAKEIVSLANTAVDAATKVKTFTQLWDTMKEAAQSGWTQTWEIIIGDFEEARELLTGISDFFNGIIGKSADRRNKLLEQALSSSPFGKLAEKINTVTGATEAMSKATQDYGKIVDRVIGGEFGNGQERFKALSEAGFDWAHVQNLVNERLGDSTRHATNYKEAQEELQKSQSVTIEQLVKMTDAQLKSLGFVDDEIEAFRELGKQSEKTGIPIAELAKDLDQLNGRTLLINSFKNIGTSLVTVFTAIGRAYRDMFPPMQADQLYNMIASLHKFSLSLLTTVDDIDKAGTTANKLYRTFRGLFSILKIGTTFITGGVKAAFTIFSNVLGLFGTNILDVTATIGDFFYALDNNVVTKAFEKFASGVVIVVKAVGDMIDKFLQLPEVKAKIDSFKDALLDFKEIGQNIIEGLANGIEDGLDSIPNLLIELAKRLINAIKNVLGIHSPSTVMFEIGQNIVEGLINGVQAAWGGVVAIFDKLRELVGGINWGKILAVGVSAALLYTVIKLANAFEALVSPLEGLGDILESTGKVINSFSKVLSALAFNIAANAIKSLAVSLAILVGSVFVLTRIDTKALWASIGALAALAAIIGVLAVAAGKFGPKESVSFGGFALAIMALSTSLLIMSFAFRKIANTDPDKLGTVIVGYLTIVVSMIAILVAYGKLASTQNVGNIERAGSVFMKLGASLLMMAWCISLLSGMSAGEIAKGAAAITAFVGIMALLAVITSKSKAIAGLGKTLLAMSSSMLILVLVIKLVSGLSPSELAKGAAALVIFVGIIALLTLITRLGKAVAGLGKTLLAMTASMLIMALIVKLVSGISIGDLVKGTAALLAFTGIIALLTLITNLAPKDMPKLASTLLAMSVSIGILAGIAILLGMIDLGGLAKGITAVGLLSAFMSMMIVATRGANAVKGNLIVMTVAIAAMATAVAALSFIDPSKLMPATLAVSMLMGMFALMEKASSSVTASMKTLLTMTVVVGLLATLVWTISQLEMDGAVEKSLALSTLLLAFSGAMKIMSSAGQIAPTALLSIGIMTLVVGALAGILYLIQDMPVASTLANATSLSVLLLALSGACVILAGVGATGPAAFIGIGALATLIAGIGTLLVAIGALVTYVPQVETFLDNGIPVLEKIGYALGSFFGNIVGGFTGGISSGLPTIGENVSGFLTNLQPGIEAVKGIDDSAVEGMKSLVKMMTMMAGGSIVEAIASFVTGSSSMETFSSNLSVFADAICEFSDKVAGKIDEDDVLAAANAGKMLAEMQSAVAGEGVISFFVGEKDIAQFGEQIKTFGEAMVEFSNIVSQNGGINEEAITAAANSGQVMTELQSSIEPTGGVLQFFTGDKDLSAFGEQLKSFGSALVGFSNTVSTEGSINETAITAAANAGKIMSEMQTTIVPTGGVLQFFSGSQDLISFGNQLVAFGEAIVRFSNAVSTEGSINETAILAAANAGKIMSEMQTSIVPTGGVIDFFKGTSDMAKFGEQLVGYGTAIAAFSATVSGNGGINEDAVTAAANAGRIMAELQKAIPEDHWFDGKQSLSEFGGTLVSFGGSIKAYSERVAGIDPMSVDTSIGCARSLITIASSLVGLDTSGIESFKSVGSVGSTLRSYAVKVTGLDYASVYSSISYVRQLTDLIKSMVGLDASGVASFGSAMESLGKTSLSKFSSSFSTAAKGLTTTGGQMVDNLVSGFKNKQQNLINTGKTLADNVAKEITNKKNKFKDASVALMKEFIAGITEQKTFITTEWNTILTENSTLITNSSYLFKSAGKAVVQGFADGIEESTIIAEIAARAMVRAAIEAAEDEADINSPSKEFYKLGAFSGKGFVNALGDYAKTSYKAGAKMASSAKDGLSNTIGRLSDVINSDIDPNPTIRPVLDLSNVRSGAGTIGDMLNMGSSVSVLSNVGRIGYAMNANRQNGTNDDIITAINKLRGDLGKVGGSSYTINGVTYDDGSNVSDAVKSLIRAARIERRV